MRIRSTCAIVWVALSAGVPIQAASWEGRARRFSQHDMSVIKSLNAADIKGQAGSGRPDIRLASPSPLNIDPAVVQSAGLTADAAGIAGAFAAMPLNAAVRFPARESLLRLVSNSDGIGGGTPQDRYRRYFDSAGGGAVEAYEAAEPSLTAIEQAYAQAAPSAVDIVNYVKQPSGLAIQSRGSGFVWDQTGRILTNHHVVEGADSIYVRLHDQSRWVADAVMLDPWRDIALLKINAPAERLRPVAPGDSSGLKIGQRVLAIGSPLGLEGSLTQGIISGLDRRLDCAAGPISGLIQTDVLMLPGSSGGLLIDVAARLIGMNVAILGEPSQILKAFGFSIPVNHIKEIMQRLLGGRLPEGGQRATIV